MLLSMYPASILRKSTSDRHRPVSYPDGPMTARYRFTLNADWVYTYSTKCLAHSLYTRNSLDPQNTEAWKYYHDLRFKQTPTKNSSPGS